MSLATYTLQQILEKKKKKLCLIVGVKQLSYKMCKSQYTTYV